MRIDYKKELENAARNMILVHEPATLMEMIVRTIIQKVKVNHAGILLHDKDKDAYVLRVSRGSLGLKVPRGFVRMDLDNPLIRFFRERQDKKFLFDGAFIYDEGKKLLRRNINSNLKQILKGALSQMELFEVVVCVSSYFREELLGILLLGKKKNGKKFAKKELDFFTALASDVAMAIRNAQLFKELQSELEKEHKLFIHTTIALAAAIDAKDHYTHGHTARVTSICLEIAKKLSRSNKKVSDGKFLERLHIAALLHDIGKIGIPESILNKEGPLTKEERDKIEEHPLVGAVILRPIRELGDSILGVKYHHEKYDGTGYPEGLKDDQIPLIASIISVADSFDAMTTERPYRRRPLSKEEAVEEIRRLSGKQYAPLVTNVLVELYQEGKI